MPLQSLAFLVHVAFSREAYKSMNVAGKCLMLELISAAGEFIGQNSLRFIC